MLSWYFCFVGFSGHCDAEDVLVLRGRLYNFALVQQVREDNAKQKANGGMNLKMGNEKENG